MDLMVQKICCVCGIDVSRIRRTRDPRHHYYCRPCYDMLLDARRRRMMKMASVRQVTSQQNIADAVDQDLPPPPVISFESTRPSTTISRMPRAERGESHPPDIALNESAEGGANPPPRTSRSTSRRGLVTSSLLSRDMPDAAAERDTSSSDTASAAVESGKRTEPSVALPLQVTARRRRPRRRRKSRHIVCVSDLLGEDAQAEVAAARLDPQRLREPEVPVSPITNPPVTDIVAEYAQMLRGDSTRKLLRSEHALEPFVTDMVAQAAGRA
jgi:hypothetical protein